jgi:hypothetical protein
MPILPQPTQIVGVPILGIVVSILATMAGGQDLEITITVITGIALLL